MTTRPKLYLRPDWYLRIMTEPYSGPVLENGFHARSFLDQKRDAQDQKRQQRAVRQASGEYSS